jgi:hypothetical protein
MSRICPIPGKRDTEWLENARQQTTEFRNPMPDVPLIPGRSERAKQQAKQMGMERELARKWEK